MLIAAVVFLAAIAGVWAGRELFPSPPSPGVERHSLLHDGLELDEAQRTKLETLESRFAVRRRALELELRADNARLADAMAHSQQHLQSMHGGQNFSQVIFNLAEYQVRDGRDAYRWDGGAWYGGDINRLVLKTEGEGNFGRSLERAELQALYARAIGPFTDFQAGIRYDFKPNPSRVYATVGFESLAPGFFDVEGALFLSSKGDVLGRVEGYYDQRITQRLILQPRLEAEFAAQDVPEDRIGSGLSDLELGLRLRYEVKREFAPYIGVSYERRVGRSARFAREDGEDASSTSLVLGIRTWF